ncbi:MAG: hypothetical protein LBJ00_12440 [Planctomycetaceae bacterium]|nr:hypothetical protein [Planctomycetaceae bacterium]
MRVCQIGSLFLYRSRFKQPVSVYDFLYKNKIYTEAYSSYTVAGGR